MRRGKNGSREAKKPRFGKNLRVAITIASVIFGAAGIYFSYVSPSLGLVQQWVVAILSLVIAGILIGSANGLPGGYGVYLLSTRYGIKFIDGLSRRNVGFWNGMSIWGMVMGFGMLSYPFLGGRLDKRLFALGLLSIAFTFWFVIPLTITGFQFIEIPQIQAAIQNAAPQASSGTPWLQYGIDALSLVAGLTGLIVVLLLENSVVILAKLYFFAASILSGPARPEILNGIVPGVAPLIPGIDIPLFAGIVSLAILLAIHEASHGVLARIANVRLKAVGLVILGIIPVGAFVEPDEKQVARLEGMRQTRILAAGTSANFMGMMVFFVLLFLLIQYVVPGVYTTKVFVSGTTPGLPANGILKAGMQILYWNGYRIDNLSSFTAAAKSDTPGARVTVTTNASTYTFNAVAVGNSTKGYVGVNIYSTYLPARRDLYSNAVAFLYSLFALSLLFNFSLAVINLLPIPAFDGWRLYKVNMKDNRVTKMLAAFVTVLILVNLFSWVLIAFA